MENENLVQVFNAIVESIGTESEFNHDRYFRYAFSNPERTAELLTIFSEKNESLKTFLETVDLSSLKGAPENFSMSKLLPGHWLSLQGGVSGYWPRNKPDRLREHFT